MVCVRCAATESSRTENLKISGIAPGRFAMASSPSHVLQIHPLRESFWTYPARSPVEYAKLSVIQVQSAAMAVGTTRIPSPRTQGHLRRFISPIGHHPRRRATEPHLYLTASRNVTWRLRVPGATFGGIDATAADVYSWSPSGGCRTSIQADIDDPGLPSL